MNLFSQYQKKIIINLKKLEKKKLIKVPSTLRGIVVEVSPKNQNAHISCNAAMILSKSNNKPPHEIAEILRKSFLMDFKVAILH